MLSPTSESSECTLVSSPQASSNRVHGTDHGPHDTAPRGITRTSVLLPSKALTHANNSLPALKALFQSVVPNDPGFTIQAGYATAGPFVNSMQQRIYITTSAPLRKFSDDTVDNIQSLVDPYRLVFESEHDPVEEQEGYGKWRSPMARPEDLYHHCENCRLVRDLQTMHSGRGNDRGGHTISFASETSLDEDMRAPIQKIAMNGTVFFKQNLNDVTAAVKQFGTSSKTWYSSCEPTSRGHETYGLVNLRIGMDVGTSYFTDESSPTMLWDRPLVETIPPHPTFLHRVSNRFCGYPPIHLRTRWLHQVCLQQSGLRVPHLDWTYNILDEKFRDSLSLPSKLGVCPVYDTLPRTTLRNSSNECPAPATFSFQLRATWALPAPQHTSGEKHLYRSFAICTEVIFPHGLARSVTSEGDALAVENEQAGERLVDEKEVTLEGHIEHLDRNGEHSEPRVSLTTNALIPRGARYNSSRV